MTKRAVAGAGAAATLVLVTALWLSHGGGAETVAGGWPGVTAFGRLLGLWAADLMLLQVLLMARIPAVEQAFGQDQLARWHRLTGFTSFHLLLAHIVVITFGYAGQVQEDTLSEFWSLITTFPGMLLALAGTGLLVLVVVTSIRAARRRLRYESWHLLHLYAYLGIALALPHQLWTGADFIGSPAARAYWWTLYLGAAGAVVVFRLGLPAWRSLRHRLRVSHVVAEGPGLTTIYLRGQRLDRLPVRAGQFFLWRFLDGPGWSRAHPYSLSGPPRGDHLRITVKNLGDDSARVASLTPGTPVLVEGPYGRLTGAEYPGGPITLLACGVGLTPLLALLWELPYGPGEATLIYRVRSEADLAFQAELDWLAEQRGVRVVRMVGPRPNRASWLPRRYADLSDLDALRVIVPDIARHTVYICGPDGWTNAVMAAATAAGVTRTQLHTEQFAW
jgi:predicted ferric reductase